MTFPVKLVGVLMLVWLLNYFAATQLNYPFAYCWGDALLRPVLAPYASLALLACAGYLMFVLMRHGVGMMAAQVVVVMMLIGGADQMARTLFAFGKECVSQSDSGRAFKVRDMFAEVS